MSGETRIVQPAVLWGVVALPVCAGLAYLARGSDGAASAVIAVTIVLANAAAAALFSAVAGRFHSLAAGFIALPSFAVRMVAILVALSFLKDASFIDKPTFALTFGAAVTAVLLLEARSFKRTPWLALTLGPKKETP